jgi:hypothetical protein
LPLARKRAKITKTLSAKQVRATGSQCVVVPLDESEHCHNHVAGGLAG